MRAAVDIFCYTDYRVFLQDHVKEKKRVQPTWSLGAWAKKLKIGGAPALSMILNGHRHPGIKIAVKFADYFQFNELERSYFLGLIHLSKNKNEIEVAMNLKDRLQETNSKKDVKFIDERLGAVLSGWLPYAIREMTHLRDFQPTAQWIAENLRFKANMQDIKRTIANLKDMGLVAMDENNAWRSTNVCLNTERDVENHAARLYQDATLGLSREALSMCPMQERDFSSLTMTIRFDHFPTIKRRIAEFLDAIQREFEVDGKGDATIQLQVQSFPYNKFQAAQLKRKSKHHHAAN